MQIGFRGILLIPLLILSGSLAAQNNSVSPYSRLGLGDLHPRNFARGLTMGGANMGLIDPYNINYSNPASYSALSLTTFELGFESINVEQMQQNPDITVVDGNNQLSYFSIGVPLKSWWGSAIGIKPYSFKGYNITTSRMASDSVEVTDNFNGSGGLNQFFWGNAFKVAEGLSLGVNMSYLFGKVEENYLIVWDGNSNNTLIEEVQGITGFQFDFGVQYEHTLKNDLILGAGLSFSNASDLNASVENYTFTVSNSGFALDSLTSAGTANSNITLPGELKFGLSIGKRLDQSINNAWAVNADVELYNGSQFVGASGERPLSNGFRTELGAFMVPRYSFTNLNRSTGYLSIIEYRLGAFYEKTPISIAGNDIVDYGITFGLGLPIRQRGLAPGEVRASTINTGIVLGRRGTLDNGLIQESYLKFYLGITLNDKWFNKYKYR